MIEEISTGTICPYPFTFANKSSNDLSSCTVTYGEALDPGLLIIQVVFSCFFGLISLPIFVRRLYRMVLLARQKMKPWYSSSQSKMYLAAITLSISVVVEMVDPFGQRNFAHPYLFLIADGFFAGSLMMIGFFFVDFYVTTAERANFKEGLSTRLIITVLILTFINFIGKWAIWSDLVSNFVICKVFQVIGFFIPKYYKVFESLKFFGGFLLEGMFIIVGLRARAALLEILTRGGVRGDTSLRAAFGCKAAPETPTTSQRSVLTVKRKFAEYITVMIFTLVATLVFGLLRLGVLTGNDDYHWEVKLEGEQNLSLVLFRLVGVMAIVVVIRTFKVPKATTDSGTNKGFMEDPSSRQLRVML